MEAIAYAYHEVVGILKLVELVAYVQKQAAGHMYLKRKHLIEVARVGVAQDVVAYAALIENMGITSSPRNESPAET